MEVISRFSDLYSFLDRIKTTYFFADGRVVENGAILIFDSSTGAAILERESATFRFTKHQSTPFGSFQSPHLFFFSFVFSSRFQINQLFSDTGSFCFYHFSVSSKRFGPPFPLKTKKIDIEPPSKAPTQSKRKREIDLASQAKKDKLDSQQDTQVVHSRGIFAFPTDFLSRRWQTTTSKTIFPNLLTAAISRCPKLLPSLLFRGFISADKISFFFQNQSNQAFEASISSRFSSKISSNCKKKAVRTCFLPKKSSSGHLSRKI